MCSKTELNMHSYFLRGGENGSWFMAPYRLYEKIDENDGEIDTDAFEKGLSLEPHKEDYRSILSRLKIIQPEIGKGAFGRVFRCTLNGNRELIVKLPTTLLNLKVLEIDGNGYLTRNEIYTNEKDKKQQDKEAKNEFMDEFKNAEDILNPLMIKKMKFQAGYAHSFQTSEELSRFHAETLEMKQHPGYAHLHKLVHFVPEIPCILSEPCTGCVIDLIDTKPDIFSLNTDSIHFLTMPDIWVDIAYQMGQAMLFMRDICKVSHNDIKPENIFYTPVDASHHGSGSKYHFQLGDYGICSKSNEEIRLTSLLDGTPWYLPLKGHWTSSEICTRMQISIFSYAASLLSMINFPVRWFNRIGRGDLHGFYFDSVYHGHAARSIRHMEKLLHGITATNLIFPKMEYWFETSPYYLFRTIKHMLLPRPESSEIEAQFDDFQDKLTKIMSLRKKKRDQWACHHSQHENIHYQMGPSERKIVGTKRQRDISDPERLFKSRKFNSQRLHKRSGSSI